MMTFADLCAGIGGFRTGLEAAGWTCAFSCEIDDSCEATYRANFGNGFDARSIFDFRAEVLKGIDAICCGFPCQPFSIAGKQRGFDDERGGVLERLLAIIAEADPALVILENVPNFAAHNRGASLRLVVEFLSKQEYDVHHAILNSAFFGVPQSRPRLYIVAAKRRLNSLFLNLTTRRTQPEPFRRYIAIGDHSIPISERWNEYIDLYTGDKSLSMMSFQVPKTRRKIERANAGANLKDCVLQLRSSGIRACSVDAPLPTFAVSHSGGGAMIPVYTKERRHLSLAEMKSLMGFPTLFKFPVARTHAIKQLANAVCPAVITSIARDLRSVLVNKLQDGRVA